MRPDVLVVGAGVIGCSIAREVAAAGASVLVIDRGRPGGEASGAAAGLLTPQSHAVSPGPFVDLALASLGLFPDLARELARETSIDVDFRRCGSVRVPAGADDAEEMSRVLAWQRAAGLEADRIGADRLARLTRNLLAPPFEDAIEFRGEGTVNARRFVSALAKSAETRGARLVLGEAAESLRLAGNRCTGVATRSGPIDAGIVVDAAGAWAECGLKLAFPLPVRPIRGQIVELAAKESAPPCPILRGDFYVVPLSDGRLLLGSTQEDAGFEKRVTASAVAMLLDRAIELIPSLREAEVTGAWCGLRPATPDALPVLGPTPVDGFLVAAGHFRNGILLAPITARILAALILGQEPPVDVAPFRAERFAFTAQNESW